MRFLAGLLLVATLGGQSISDADRRRFEEIRAKHQRGEAITPEERAFAQQMMERRNQQGAAARNREYARQHPARESTGMTPLCDLGTGKYKGEEGGLYPGGGNVPPAAHRKAGLAAAHAVAPVDGSIVLLSIGMSNTTQEFSMFQKLAAAEPGINPRLRIVDGAQGGQTAAITARPEANFWKVVDRRMAAAGATASQVQVVWLKQANAQPSQPFPAEAKKLKADLVATLENLRKRYPNLKLVYFSSRIYGGYAATPLNPEPHAYETAFAVKWLIADQIAGEAPRSPWLGWGPYLWADGMKGRKDGMIWTRDDLGPDGTHPSMAGREKVARQLLEFFKTDATAKVWFLK